MNNQAVVNLFEFSHGITINIDNKDYKTFNCNPEGIARMLNDFDIDEVVLVGPKVITSKYERDLMDISLTNYNKNYKITSMEG